MTPEDSAQSKEAGENVVQNDIPGFFVSWLNSDGEREEGPLSLLWRLIESYKVDIFDVSLYRITQDFYEFIHSAEDLQLELTSPFLVMAARLLYYKSKALLPDPGFDEPDTDPRLPPELIQQLLEYRRFQMASDKLRELDDVAAGMMPRRAGFQDPDSSDHGGEGLLELDIVDLIKAYSGVIKRHQQLTGEESEMTLAMEEHSLEDRIKEIRAMLENAVSFAFEDLFQDLPGMTRGQIVVTFLAILELTKLSEIIIRQKVLFGEILIYKKSTVVI